MFGYHSQRKEQEFEVDKGSSKLDSIRKNQDPKGICPHKDLQNYRQREQMSMFAHMNVLNYQHTKLEGIYEGSYKW